MLLVLTRMNLKRGVLFDTLPSIILHDNTFNTLTPIIEYMGAISCGSVIVVFFDAELGQASNA